MVVCSVGAGVAEGATALMQLQFQRAPANLLFARGGSIAGELVEELLGHVVKLHCHV